MLFRHESPCLTRASDVQHSDMKRAILLVAFGASSAQGQSALKNFDARVRARFPGLPVRWAYTSLLLRERLAKARQKSDSVLKALRRLGFEKFTEVAVQPLQTIPGREHAEVCAAVDEVAAQEGLVCRVGASLLAEPEDVAQAALALTRHLPPERAPGEDVVLMGHGARHAAVARYGDLAQAVSALDPRVHVGTMNGAVVLEDILPRLTSKRVWLMPLLRWWAVMPCWTWPGNRRNPGVRALRPTAANVCRCSRARRNMPDLPKSGCAILRTPRALSTRRLTAEQPDLKRDPEQF